MSTVPTLVFPNGQVKGALSLVSVQINGCVLLQYQSVLVRLSPNISWYLYQPGRLADIRAEASRIASRFHRASLWLRLRGTWQRWMPLNASPSVGLTAWRWPWGNGTDQGTWKFRSKTRKMPIKPRGSPYGQPLPERMWLNASILPCVCKSSLQLGVSERAGPDGGWFISLAMTRLDLRGWVCVLLTINYDYDLLTHYLNIDY